EAATARDSNRLVPASVDGTSAPLGFGQYQSVNLSRLRGRHKKAAIGALLEAIGDRQAPELPKVHQRSSRRWFAAGAVPIAVAAFAFYAAVPFRPRPSEPMTMAVLPFEALPADESNSPFAEG